MSPRIDITVHSVGMYKTVFEFLCYGRSFCFLVLYCIVLYSKNLHVFKNEKIKFSTR